MPRRGNKPPSTPLKGRRKRRPASQVFKPRVRLDASQVSDRRRTASSRKGPGRSHLTVAPIVHVRRNLKVAAVPSLRQAMDALGGFGPKGGSYGGAPGPVSRFSQMVPGILQSTGYLPKPSVKRVRPRKRK